MIRYIIASRWTFTLVGGLTLVSTSLSRLWSDPPVWFVIGAVAVGMMFLTGLAGQVAFLLSRRESTAARQTSNDTVDERK
ncbi:hypothetical protein [Agreia sp. Leaf283]|uniref:hypothetical protein n=1 Tax=Agreia sp. Leaf283 TaxID=1736321 RepID=UPI0006F9CB00|nr:hypothetical protein [Agreia sp. Leaf283]KQP57175.1 hypothetical protein ASF51_04700 [Agreia sp. Leaf283]